jgi:hypothetical protein
MEDLVKPLSRWMARGHSRAVGKKCAARDMEPQAKRLLEDGVKTGFVKVLSRNGQPIAVFIFAKSASPRIRGERSLFFSYDFRYRKRALRWIYRELRSGRFPRYSSVGLVCHEDKYFREALGRAGFSTRYEILRGETKKAYRALRKWKNPPPNLAHLGLELRPFRSEADIRRGLRLQRRVSLQDPSHVYYSHTAAQLRKDKKEYRENLRSGNALILGIYKDRELVGTMMASVHEVPGKFRNGGISFFLDRQIQGKGIAKTGYRLLLEFLIRKKVKEFFGGTSQPAVSGLGKIMGRKTIALVYLKASWKKR